MSTRRWICSLVWVLVATASAVGTAAGGAELAPNAPFAEAVLIHPQPEQVVAELGTVDGEMPPIAVAFRDTGVDVIGGQAPPVTIGPNGVPAVTTRVDLTPQTKYLDGRHEWYLRLTDASHRGGTLQSFRVVTLGGVQSVQQCPATLRADRALEARLVPMAATAPAVTPPPAPTRSTPDVIGSSAPPLPAQEVPLGTEPTVFVQAPAKVEPGERVIIDITASLGAANGTGRFGLVYELPAGWIIQRLEPATFEPENTLGKAVWRQDSAPPRQRFRITVAAPVVGWGYQYFSGSWKLGGSPIVPTAGATRVWLNGTQPASSVVYVAPGYVSPYYDNYWYQPMYPRVGFSFGWYGGSHGGYHGGYGGGYGGGFHGGHHGH